MKTLILFTTLLFTTNIILAKVSDSSVIKIGSKTYKLGKVVSIDSNGNKVDSANLKPLVRSTETLEVPDSLWGKIKFYATYFYNYNKWMFFGACFLIISTLGKIYSSTRQRK